MKVSEERFRSFISSKGVICLEDKYVNASFPHTFRCLVHPWHIFNKKWRDFNSSKYISLCCYCSGTRSYCNEMIDVALPNLIKRIGECPIRGDDLIRLECQTCFNKWEVGVKYAHNTYCRECDSYPKWTKPVVEEFLLTRSIVVKNWLQYRTVVDPVIVSCPKGHEHTIIVSELFRSLKGGTTGCRICSVAASRCQTIHSLYEARGFKLCDDYINMHTRCLTECLRCGSRWRTKPVCIIHAEVGCPDCSEPNTNEILIKNILSNLYKDISYYQFPIKGPIYDECGKLIRNYIFADFFINDGHSSWIIEYNGAQHYSPMAIWNIPQDEAEERLRQQKIRDEWLRNYCLTNQINLIEIDGRKFKKTKLIQLILSLVEKGKLPSSDNYEQLKADYTSRINQYCTDITNYQDVSTIL